MEKEKNLMSDEELEKIGGGYTVTGYHEICDQFEPTALTYIPYEYCCRHCVHYVNIPGIGFGKCDIK